jgi:ribosomal protein S18 acetylase RimI-like enzyme
VALDVTITNVAAVRLYQRAGFVAVGERIEVRPGSPLRAQPMELEPA